MSTTAYGAGAPHYPSAELQRAAITGRLQVAVGIRDRAEEAGNVRRAARWGQVVNELLDKLSEVQG